MSYSEFLASIKSPDLLGIAEYWNAARHRLPMPGWGDIRPSKIAPQLCNIWVYRYDRAEDAFTGRLAGDRIEMLFGKSFRGTPMSELYPSQDYPRLFARAKRVVCDPALYHGDGMVFRHLSKTSRGERIMLPLAGDGTNGDGVLGATIYQTASGLPATDTPEDEHWFAL
jgi:hypothetical protein